MKKLLLVVLIGMALAFNIFGLIKQFTVEEIEEIDHIEETTIMVYVE